MSQPNPACFHVKAKYWFLGRKEDIPFGSNNPAGSTLVSVHTGIPLKTVRFPGIQYDTIKKKQSQIPVYWYKPLHQKSWAYTLAA